MDRLTFAALVSVLAALLVGCVDPGDVSSSLLARYHRELAERGPQDRPHVGSLQAYMPQPPAPGPQLRTVDDRIYVSLQDAIMRTLANNPSVRVVSYTPEIRREDMIRAAAAFDLLLFGQVGIEKGDVPPSLTNPFSGGLSDQRTIAVGARQRLITGTQWQTTWGLTRTWSDIGTSPRTSWVPSVSFEITQPLLRGFGPEFNLAELRIARLNYESSEAEFRQNVEQLVFDVHRAYFALIQARINYEIQQRLLKVTQETLERIRSRGVHDATRVEIKQAEAAVQTRQASLIRAGKFVHDAADTLARLISDPQLNLINHENIIPTTALVEDRVQFDPTDQLLVALENSPVLAQARKAIGVAAININVAENQLLPQLDLQARATVSERDVDLGDAIDDMGDLNYIGYLLQLSFEYPVGNRQREAELRQARYRHLQAQASYQDTMDTVALQVRERIRQIEISFEEMAAQKEAVSAARAQLEALEARERLLGRLSPEFLNVKLGAQQTLASAMQAWLQARIDYNTALVELAQVTGVLLDENQVVTGPARASGGRLLLPIISDESWPAPAEPIEAMEDMEEIIPAEAPVEPAGQPRRPVPPVEPAPPAEPIGPIRDPNEPADR